MPIEVIPVLRVASVDGVLGWWTRLGFEEEWRHQFEPDYPVYCGIRRADARIHLSEHTGDARPDTLVYVFVDDLEAIASEFGAEIGRQPWGHELALVDPDGNRLRLGEPPRP